MKKVTLSNALFLEQFENVTKIEPWLQLPNGNWEEVLEMGNEKLAKSFQTMKDLSDTLDHFLAMFIKKGMVVKMYCKGMRVYVETKAFNLSFPVGFQTGDLKYQTV